MKKRLHNFSKIAEVKGNTDLALKELSVFVQLHAEMKELSHFCVSTSSISYLIFLSQSYFQCILLLGCMETSLTYIRQ